MWAVLGRDVAASGLFEDGPPCTSDEKVVVTCTGNSADDGGSSWCETRKDGRDTAAVWLGGKGTSSCPDLLVSGCFIPASLEHIESASWGSGPLVTAHPLRINFFWATACFSYGDTAIFLREACDVCSTMSVVGGSWDHDYPILELVPLVAGCSTFANDFDLILDDDLTVAVEVEENDGGEVLVASTAKQ
ncbi:hypothetical protein K503DRAFT_779019 [Rhizopogon vinicolor AM-OR11-026]|uniref:Uncharacterized protein n=1 Tax=Rhizopogon vinicolor AM-OR11-026 TaxID=1314800 RepID=A0A1B7NG66_9AGAM|nr:hypothetical protein K503DRAFT_779019 [Rhizopogon vinicolor AM-OR11-026]